jgi:hypothetical protein
VNRGGEIIRAGKGDVMSLLPNVEKRDLLADSEPSYDLDWALVEAAEEMKFDWPEFLPVERIKAGISEIALGCILFAALLTFVSVHLKSDPRYT